MEGIVVAVDVIGCDLEGLVKVKGSGDKGVDSGGTHGFGLGRLAKLRGDVGEGEWNDGKAFGAGNLGGGGAGLALVDGNTGTTFLSFAISFSALFISS